MQYKHQIENVSTLLINSKGEILFSHIGQQLKELNPKIDNPIEKESILKELIQASPRKENDVPQKINIGSQEFVVISSCDEGQNTLIQILPTNPPEETLEQAILENMNDAVLIIDKELKIQSRFSKALEKQLGMEAEDIKNAPVIETLFKNLPPEKLRRLEFDLTTSFSGNELQWFCTSSGFPSKISGPLGKDISYKVIFQPIYNESNLVEKILITISDISEIEALTAEANKKQEKLEKIADLLSIEDSVYRIFLDETKKILQSCRKVIDKLTPTQNESIGPTIDILFRNIHTLKGSAGLFCLSGIQNVAHQAETYFATLRAEKGNVSIKSIEDLKENINYIEQEVESYEHLRRKIISPAKTEGFQKLSSPHLQWLITLMNRLTQSLHKPDLSVRDIDCIHYELKGALATIGKISLKYYIERFDELVIKIAEESGKKVAPLKVYSSINYFEKDAITVISEIVVHCISNSVVHGIETLEERKAKNKPSHGKINMRIMERTNYLRLTIEDDGRGIDPDKMSALAISKSLLSTEKIAKMSDNDKQNLILLPGFSSQESSNKFSGRGVGIGAVNIMVDDLGGKMSIDSEKGNGTRIIIDLPHFTTSFIHGKNLLNLSDSVSKSFGTIIDQNEPNLRATVMYNNRFGIDRIFSGVAKLVAAMPIKPERILISHQILQPIKDSAIHYQVKIVYPDNAQPHILMTDEKYRLKYETLQTLALSLDGNFEYNQSSGCLEISFPSKLPLPFFEMKFKVFITDQSLQKASQFFKESFQKIFGQDKLEIISSSESKIIPEQPENVYMILCTEKDTKKDLEWAISRKDSIVIQFSQNPDLLSETLTEGPQKTILTKLPYTKSSAAQLMELAILNRITERLYQKNVTETEKRYAS